MIDLVKDAIAAGDKPSVLEPVVEKKYRYDESAALNVVLTNMDYVKQYRDEHKENSRIYSDVRIEFEDHSVLLMSIEEFIRILRGAGN